MIHIKSPIYNFARGHQNHRTGPGGGWYADFATRCCHPKGVVRLSTGIVEEGHHCSSSWWRHYKRIRDSEYCGGSGEVWRRLRHDLRAVRVRWFHPARWCTMLQRHYSGRSCMAVVFSVRCCPFLSFPYRFGPWLDDDFRRWERLLAASAMLLFCLRCTVYCPRRCPNPTGLSCLVWDMWCGLCQRPNPTGLSWIELSLACVETPIQSVGVVTVTFFLFSWLWPSSDIILYFFLLYQ